MSPLLSLILVIFFLVLAMAVSAFFDAQEKLQKEQVYYVPRDALFRQ